MSFFVIQAALLIAWALTEMPLWVALLPSILMALWFAIGVTVVTFLGYVTAGRW